MIDPPPAEQVIGGAAGFVGLLLILQRLWRTFRRERVEGHKDQAEVNILRVWQERAELADKRADQAYKERNEAMQELGQLRAEVAALRKQVEALQARLGSMGD